jgi:phenylacetate-CoA ligase
MEILEEKSITPAELSLSKALFGAEPWNETFRVEIEEQLDLTVTDNYGLTEIIGPGVSYECGEKSGLHIPEDHFIPEIIDPDTEKILPMGTKGELVLTTITKEAYPLIRYRTGDLTSLMAEPCPCGRSSVKMSRVFERIDDMIILNGRNMFPSQFEGILTEAIGMTPNYQLIVDRVDNLDEMEIQIEVSQDIFDDEMKKLNELEIVVVRDVKEKFDFIPKVTLVEPRSLKRKMKKRRVIDKRKLQ